MKVERLENGISHYKKMKTFVKNKINTDFDLIANELRRARQNKKLSLEEVSRRTKINIKYLIALEEGDFLCLPKGLYAKNFLRQYSIFLGISLDNILEIYDDLNDFKKESTKNLFSNQVVKNKYFLAIPKFLRNMIILMVVFIFFSYLLFSFQKLNSAPILKISYPPNNLITSENIVEISGSSEKDVDISINGENILLSLDGTFFQKINLKLGINEIVIEAKKKYGKTNTIKKQILLKE